MGLASGRQRASAVAAPPAKKDTTKKQRKAWRMSANQAEKQANDSFVLERKRVDAFKQATLDLQASQQAKAKTGRNSSGKSAKTITKEANASLPEDVKPLAESSLKEAVLKGRAGLSPLKPGPKSKVPVELTDLAHTYIGLTQQTQVPKPSRVKRAMRASLQGSEHEDVSTRAAYAALKKRKVGKVSTGPVHTQDARRWIWMTWDNVNE